MKMFLMAAAACTLLAGCATGSTSTPGERGNRVAQEEENYVPTGSNIPRKKGQGTSVVATMSAVELESARMDPGKAPELPPGQ